MFLDKDSRITRVRNDLLNGGVSAGNGHERVQGMLDAIHGPGRELSQADSTDHYGPGRVVSIERSADRQRNLQEALDKEIERENLGEDFVKKGRPPCLRVRNSF